MFNGLLLNLYIMVTFKVKFRFSSIDSREGVLYYQIIHNRMVRQIGTKYRLFPHEWDNQLSAVVLLGNDTERERYLLTLKQELKADIDRLKRIISSFHCSHRSYTSDDIVCSFQEPTNEKKLSVFMQTIIQHLRSLERIRTSEAYTTTLNSFMLFRNKKDVLLDEIDSELVAAYEAWLQSRGVSANTSSFYMRNLRAVYNRAVRKDIVQQRYPFKYVYTGIDKTVKRALPLKIIKQIKEMDLVLFPSLDFARSMFMFSFYTRGMSFVDMAYLKKKDLQCGSLSYRRKKTGQQLFIKWEPCMSGIINKYPISDSLYLLPIIKMNGTDEREQYLKMAHFVNAKLKEIGKRLELSIPLTMYVARHSWASIAKNENIPISIISEAMGHDSETTTLIYLASMDTSAVDNANKQILQSL